MTSPDAKSGLPAGSEPQRFDKLGMMSGVFVPVFLSIMSILMFLRFGLILGQVGVLGIVGLLVVAYGIDLLTILSLSAIASNGEVKGGGAYFLISRSLGPEFGGSIGILFFLAQALNIAMNVIGLIDCIRLHTAALVLCTGLNLLGSATFSKASSALLAILTLSLVSIPLSGMFKEPFHDDTADVEFTGFSWDTLAANAFPRAGSDEYRGLTTFRQLFGILFPATSGIFAGASMSGKLKDPSKAIPIATLWAMLTTFLIYLLVVLCLAASTTHESLLANANVVLLTNLSAPIILAGECAVTFVSALICMVGSASLLQALGRDGLLPGLSVFGMGAKKNDDPILAILMTHVIAQIALLADLNRIATLISMGYQMTFFVMNLACFLLKIGSAPNFRPGFKFFNWQTALIGSLSSGAAMFFIHETYAAIARWGDVSQNLIYHQVRKYLLRLKPEHIKFWRPHIILLINDPRRQTRLVQFCNSMKKGSLYILGHVIVTENFDSGVDEARLQQQAWTNYISETSRIKAFLQLSMSPSLVWGIRNLILSAGLGGMRPNIAVLGFYNMDDLRKFKPGMPVPQAPRRRRVDTSARLLAGVLPTDVIRTEGMMSPTDYMVVLEDLALKYRLNVAVAHGFDSLETPRRDGSNAKKYIDLWPIQMSAELASHGKNVLTTNFDTYTLILQLGHILRSVRDWRRVYTLRVMVFVEYEGEVEEESARVKALLEKLRIQAQVLVFWLAAGHLSTYELIINGKTDNAETEIMVSDALRHEEWWDELQDFRGQSDNMGSSRETPQMAHWIDLAVGRPGYNPHQESGSDRRRQSVTEVTEMPKRPDIAMLAKWGVNVGIHTHHLPEDVLHEPRLDDALCTITEHSDSDGEYGLDPEDHAAQAAPGSDDWAKLPLLTRGRQPAAGGSSARVGRGRQTKSLPIGTSQPPTYGSLSTAQTLAGKQDGIVSQHIPELVETGASPPLQAGQDAQQGTEPFPSLRPPAMPELLPNAPGRSRSSSASRFSSRPVPETRVIAEAEGPKLSFAPLPSKPAPETHVEGGDATNDAAGGDDSGAGSTYSTQSVALSFNDLPSRAQHLILNELMRQHSQDTAVLMSTLPIPSEGTSLDETATIRYLSDVEILYHELPPTMMVLSNNMTVTVSL
ncbi:amino acid permease [Hirsutella rhossiliensis]|uniref:Amino acid permease domain-containing protein n=1 Tax=Hirsutella rhossiliensis TaxID=111463 RepID=A0A9P8SLL8_9HYPO|nr:amino acid permease domain-containing protein [Hirsutella rhossiliensis]KAH0965286.1 amino acid permease domain-containing protein [Hirsutella rhossiliensis]